MTGPARRRRLQLARRRAEQRRGRARDRVSQQDLARIDQRIERDLVRIRSLAVEDERDRLAARAAVADFGALVDELDHMSSDGFDPESADPDDVMQGICERLDWTRERLIEALAVAHYLGFDGCDCSKCRSRVAS